MTDVRLATIDDLPAIFEILNYEIASGVNTFKLEPVHAAGQAQWWSQHAADKYPVLVACDGAEVLGWASLSPWSMTNLGYYLTAEVSVWIAPENQGRGLGKLLYAALIERAREAGLSVLLSKIEASNEASIRLHRRYGFVDVGVMHRVGRKFDRQLDVLIMELQLE